MSSRPAIVSLNIHKILVARPYNHLCLRVHGTLELLKINSPLRCRRCLGGTILGRVERNITDSTTGHLNVANISIPSELVSPQSSRNIEAPYWSKKGSKIMTSSPSSMKPMKALSMPGLGHLSAPNVYLCINYTDVPPSFAPVVIETSVSGFIFLPKKGE